MKRLTPLHRVRTVFRRRTSSFHPSNVKYKWWILLNVMLGTFMAVLDATIVNVGLPKIMASFGVGIDKIEWVVTAYMLAMAVMLASAGWLADRFGYKRVYFLGLFFFTLGSFLCGLSNNENMLILARVIQGLGAGTLMPLGMAIVTREFPVEQRGMALGFWGISAAASVSFGPLIGGFLIDHFSWQLIFDVNIPIGLIALLVTVIIQREYKAKIIQKFDLLGFITSALSLPLILYALTESASTTNTQGWSSPHVLLSFAIAIILLAIFITHELTTPFPLMELRMLGNYNFGISNLMMFVFGIGMFGSTFLLPLYLQNSLGYTAIQAGAVFLPVGIIQGLTSPTVGWFGDKTNPKIPIIIGILILSASFFVNATLSFLSERPIIMLSLYMRGLGMGMVFTPLSALALVDIPRVKMAQASGMFNIIRQLGGSFGVAILATLLTSRFSFHSQNFGQSINPNATSYKNITADIKNYYIHETGSSPGTAMQLSQAAIMTQVNKEAYIEAVDDDFFIAGIITLIGVFPVILLRSKPKKEINHEIQNS